VDPCRISGGFLCLGTGLPACLRTPLSICVALRCAEQSRPCKHVQGTCTGSPPGWLPVRASMREEAVTPARVVPHCTVLCCSESAAVELYRYMHTPVPSNRAAELCCRVQHCLPSGVGGSRVRGYRSVLLRLHCNARCHGARWADAACHALNCSREHAHFTGCPASLHVIRVFSDR